MHQLGRDFRMSVTFPGGRTQDLLHIDSWDPNWQNTYYFERRVSLPKGSTVKVIAHFDNSAHPRNPHSPPKLVRGVRRSPTRCASATLASSRRART